ncbi:MULTISPECIES: extracellular solute-binding protein [Micromonospora]|uniref:extracellular solute-binding protein n=1 Tax=unclassified Micromonospora TaxID=2617518 RepID=UPI001E4300DB|nr:extracellular solute-binding protein [Micromonospora sp. NBRC 110038]
MTGPRRVTRQDVAREAGTSVAVVSYVVNDGPRAVAPATRQRVLDAIERTGYRPNAIAQALAGGRSGVLGLVVPDVSNPFFSALARAIEDEVFREGQVLLVGNSAESAVREARLITSFVERQVDGLLYVGVGHHSPVEAAIRAGIPVVALDRRDRFSDIASVVVDNFDGAAMATEHLIAHGHRRIAVIAGPSHLFTSVERIGGWRKALKAHGLPNDESLFFEAPFSRAGGYQAAVALFERGTADAVLVTDEMQALGVLAAAADAGVAVPSGLAVVTFDGTEQAMFSVPPLTTVSQPLAEIARHAVALTRPTSPEERRHIVCDTELLRRRSCGCTTHHRENHQVSTQMAVGGDTRGPLSKEDHTMTKKVGRLAGASLAVAALALSACGASANDDPNADVTITFVTPHKGVFDEAVAAFHEEHPNITVEVQIIPFAEIAAQTQARLGSKDTSIDVIAVDPPRLPSLAAQGFLKDVSADAPAMKESLTAGGISSVTWDGKQYGYPLWTSDNFLFYNKALLAKAGIAEPGPDNASRWTWDQTLAAATKAKAAGAQYGFAFEQVDAYYALQPVIMSMGGGAGLAGDGNLTPAVDTAQWRAFGDWYGKLYSSGLSPRGLASAQMPDLFKNGSVAFYVAGPARITDLQKSGLADKWGMAPLPYAAGGKVVTPTDSWAVGVSNVSEHPTAAQEFARYLSLSTDGATSASTKFNLPPVNQKAYPKYIHYIDGIAPRQTTQYGTLLTTDTDEHAVRRPSSVGYVDFETIVNKAFADIRNGGDPAQILATAQDALARQLSQYK